MRAEGRADAFVSPAPSWIRSTTNWPGWGANSTPMNRKLWAFCAVRMAPPTMGPTTIFGITGLYEGSIRMPGAGRALSGALLRTVIHPDPDLLGSVNGPVNVAPAWSVMTSPGWAELSAP